MSANQANLPVHVRSILLQNWDPIGIRGISRFDDEYDSYIPSIIKLLCNGADVYKLSRHLLQLETGAMGLCGKRERCERVAAALHKLLKD